MTHEEAIDIVRKNYPHVGVSGSQFETALRNLIPELRESEDERIRKELLAVINDLVLPDEQKVRFNAYLERQKEQKPSEWSKEDNIGWDEAFACVTRAEKAAKSEEELQNAVTAERWLKEIKFMYCVHPVKQEWSEEDLQHKSWILECLADGEKKMPEYAENFRAAYKWLKSLRPQPHWKPNGQQLDCLRHMINVSIVGGIDKQIVQDLYEQLQKLM